MGSTSEKQIICTSCGFSFELSYPKGARPPRFTACPSCRVRVDVRRASAESARDALKTGPTAAASDIISGFRRGMLDSPEEAKRPYFDGPTERPETPSYFPTNRTALGFEDDPEDDEEVSLGSRPINPNMTQAQWGGLTDKAPSIDRPVRRKPLLRSAEEEQRAQVRQSSTFDQVARRAPQLSRSRRPGDVTPPVVEVEGRRGPIGFRPPSQGSIETIPKPRSRRAYPAGVSRPQTSAGAVQRPTTERNTSLDRPTPMPGRRQAYSRQKAMTPVEQSSADAQPFKRIESKPNAATAATVAAIPPQRRRREEDRTIPDIEPEESRRAKATLLQALKEGTLEQSKSIEDELAAIRRQVSRRRSEIRQESPRLFEEPTSTPAESPQESSISQDLIDALELPEFPDDDITQPDLPPEEAQFAQEPRKTQPFLEVVKKQRKNILSQQVELPEGSKPLVSAPTHRERADADTIPDATDKTEPSDSAVSRSSIISLDSAQKAFIFGESTEGKPETEPDAPNQVETDDDYERPPKVSELFIGAPSAKKWAEPAFLDDDDDEAPELEEASQTSRGYWIAGVAIVLFSFAVAFVVWSNNTGGGDASSAGPQPPSAADSAKDDAEVQQFKAIGEVRQRVYRARVFALARVIVNGAVEFRGPAVEARYKEAVRAFVAGEKDAARVAMADAYSLGLDEVDQYILYSTLLLESAEFEKARKVLREARDRFPRQGDIGPLLARAFSEDPRFLPDTVSISGLSAIKSLGGGSTITLRFISGGETTAAFKPAQSRLQSDYRSEIAAWRLCEVLECSFKIPYNRPVRISRSNFFELYNRIDSGKQRAYASNFSDLRWRGHEPNDYLYGTEKEWIEDFTQLPIEATAVWSPWLLQGQGEGDLKDPLSKSVSAWKDNPLTSTHHGRVLSRAKEMTTRDLAQQISDMLVFDFLVGNWDRFSTVPEWWGANCQFGDGKIISIDNGAAFPIYTNSKVTDRFMRVQRFSRGLIHELRLLEKEQTKAWFFPDPSSKEEESFERFWKQRAIVLGRVDALVEQYGEDAVMAFP